jgi:hypothetical protein
VDQETALRLIDEALDASLADVSAPPGFPAAVRRRIAERPLSRLPEVLDLVGWLAVLVIGFFSALWFLPAATFVWAGAAVALAVVIPAMAFGIHALREL